MIRRNIMKILFALMLMILSCSMLTEAKAKPRLTAKKKNMAVGYTYQLKLKGVSAKAKIKWKTSKKSLISITKKRRNKVTLKAKKKGTAIVTAIYKKKKYRCKITLKAKKQRVSDNPMMNSRDVTLFYLGQDYKNYIKYDQNHLREYRFKVTGTKKEVRNWRIVGDNADYFTITDYGLLKMLWGPAYVEPYVTATVEAILEDGRKLTATVRGYSELNIYIDSVFTEFEQKYITSSMTEKEKAEKAAWYIGVISDYQLYNNNWTDIFLKGKGDCSASRYALQYMCNHMGIKAVACRDLDAHGETLVWADKSFYVIITGYNEPKLRKYSIYEISDEALEELAAKNNIDLNYFYQ